MDFTYRELSNKVGGKWDVVKDENPISKDKCIELQTVIMRFFPVISSCIGDIGELDFGDLKKAQFAISHQADIIAQCEQGFSYKDRIDTLQKSISSCYGRCRPNPNSVAELEALRNKETELEDFQKLCKTQSFKLLSGVARNLNISDGTELYCALQMVVYYVEIQCYISDIDRNTELERMLNTKDEGDTRVVLSTNVLDTVYNECNGKLWQNINKEIFKGMLVSGNINFQIKNGNRQRVMALLNRISFTITNEKAKSEWVANVEKTLKVNSLSKIYELDETNSNPNKKFNRFLNDLYVK